MKPPPVHHVGVVLDDLEVAAACAERAFGISHRPVADPSGGKLRIEFLDFDNCAIEAIQPVSAEHPLAEWLLKHGPGINHIAIQVPDLKSELSRLRSLGFEPIGAEPMRGAGGYWVAVFPPSAFGGLSVQLVQSL